MQTTSLQGKFFAPNLHYLNRMLIGGGVILIWLLGYWVWLFQHQQTPDRLLYYALIFLAGFLIIGLKEHFASSKHRGLLLDEEGFLFQQTLLGRKIGKVMWKDIADLQATTLQVSSMNTVSCVLVTFTDPAKYEQKLSTQYREYLAQHNGRFPVVSGELEIGLEEMTDWMMMYWKKYR